MFIVHSIGRCNITKMTLAVSSNSHKQITCDIIRYMNLNIYMEHIKWLHRPIHKPPKKYPMYTTFDFTFIRILTHKAVLCKSSGNWFNILWSPSVLNPLHSRSLMRRLYIPLFSIDRVFGFCSCSNWVVRCIRLGFLCARSVRRQLLHSTHNGFT